MKQILFSYLLHFISTLSLSRGKVYLPNTYPTFAILNWYYYLLLLSVVFFVVRMALLLTLKKYKMHSIQGNVNLKDFHASVAKNNYEKKWCY
jgi:hypothetical protein